MYYGKYQIPADLALKLHNLRNFIYFEDFKFFYFYICAISTCLRKNRTVNFSTILSAESQYQALGRKHDSEIHFFLNYILSLHFQLYLFSRHLQLSDEFMVIFDLTILSSTNKLMRDSPSSKYYQYKNIFISLILQNVFLQTKYN